MNRDEIRAKFLDQKSRSEKVELTAPDGSTYVIEVRQPTVAAVSGMSDTQTEKKYGTAMMLVQYCYVPGTDEKVFDETDLEVMVSTPFGDNWMKLVSAINKLSNLDQLIPEQAKN